MVNTITLKELSPELSQVIKAIDENQARYVVTNRGKPVVVMMSMDEYEGLAETVEILSDEETMKRIRTAEKGIAKGNTISAEELRIRLKI